MTRILIDRASKLFGIVEGIKFWLEWRIWIKISVFYYRYIFHRKWCSWYGYSCGNVECKYQHYDKPIVVIVDEEE